MIKADITGFVRTGEVGDTGWFESEDPGKLQMSAHAVCNNQTSGVPRKIKCRTYLAVANRLEDTVKLTRVDIIQ